MTVVHTIFRDKPRADFYDWVTAVYLDQRWLGMLDSPNWSYPRFKASEGYGTFAVAALDLGYGTKVAQRWLAESAGAYFSAVRSARNGFARHAWRCMARIGLCRDFATLGRFSTMYLKTPDAIEGKEGRGGRSPMPNDHFWHPMRALACFFGEASDLGPALDVLATMPTPKWWKHSAAWWDGITRLAAECLGKDSPRPFALLRQQGEINQCMFAQWHKDGEFERWFGELTLAFACAACGAGWEVPDLDPHPSLPLDFLRLPRRRVVVRRTKLPPLDDELHRGIEQAHKGAKKRKRKKRRR